MKISDPETRYEFLELLSDKEGTETFLVRRKEDDRLCVLKLYSRSSLLYDFSVPPAVRNLDCPFIPKFLEEGKNEEYRWEVREYVPGTPLSKFLADASGKKTLPRDEALRICLALCDILIYLHGLPDPVIHRDIKPANLIVAENGDLYLIDFGIARTRHSAPEEADTVICGTREFCAPEQFGFMQTDARADIYSFGKLLERLFPETTPPLAALIRKCTAFDPANRCRNMQQVKNALLPLTEAGRRKRKRISRILALTACAVLLLAGLIRFNNVSFREPLIRKAVQLSLKKNYWMPVWKGDLKKVEAIYIVGEEAFSTEEEFYQCLNACYAADTIPSGSLCSLEDLSGMVNLKKLCIAGENISDLSPVRTLLSLEKLEIKHNQVSDLTALTGLKSLGSVGLNGNPVTDISPLAALPNLAYLDLCGVNHYDESVFEQLDGFEYLDINNRTQSYKYLPGKYVKRLRLGAIQASDLAFLNEIHGLEEVSITHSTDHYRQLQKLGELSFTVIYE